jgi:hypothetical protein
MTMRLLPCLYAILRRLNTGNFATFTTHAKATAAARMPATRVTGKAVITIPQPANVEAIRTSAADDTTSQRLGMDHRRWRSRMA